MYCDLDPLLGMSQALVVRCISLPCLGFRCTSRHVPCLQIPRIGWSVLRIRFTYFLKFFRSGLTGYLVRPTICQYSHLLESTFRLVLCFYGSWKCLEGDCETLLLILLIDPFADVSSASQNARRQKQVAVF